MEAGYSGTPLVRKLGIKPGWRVAVVGGPDDLEALLVDLPDGVALVRGLAGEVDAVWLFATTQEELERELDAAIAALPRDGTLWISWPKRASGVPSDLNGDVLRQVVLPTGWVDIKVAAIDETWSGLRFALRRDLR